MRPAQTREDALRVAEAWLLGGRIRRWAFDLLERGNVTPLELKALRPTATELALLVWALDDDALHELIATSWKRIRYDTSWPPRSALGVLLSVLLPQMLKRDLDRRYALSQIPQGMIARLAPRQIT